MPLFSMLTIKIFLRAVFTAYTTFPNKICIGYFELRHEWYLKRFTFSILQVQLWINFITHFRQNALDVYLLDFCSFIKKVVYMSILYASRIVVCAELLIIGPFSPIPTFNMVQHYRFLGIPSFVWAQGMRASSIPVPR